MSVRVQVLYKVKFLCKIYPLQNLSCFGRTAPPPPLLALVCPTWSKTLEMEKTLITLMLLGICSLSLWDWKRKDGCQVLDLCPPDALRAKASECCLRPESSWQLSLEQYIQLKNSGFPWNFTWYFSPSPFPQSSVSFSLP